MHGTPFRAPTTLWRIAGGLPDRGASRADVIEVLRGNFPDLAARGFFRAAQPQQGAYLVQRKSQLARTPHEGENAPLHRTV